MNNYRVLYPNFLENKRIYNLAEAWWRNLFNQLFKQPELRFHRFFSNRYGNGKKMYEGNPIFDAYFPGRHKLVRIIQELPEDDFPYFAKWLDSWPMAEMDEKLKPNPVDQAKFDQPIPELVLALVLTPENSEIARKLLHSWIVEDFDESRMEELIKEFSQ